MLIANSIVTFPFYEFKTKVLAFIELCFPSEFYIPWEEIKFVDSIRIKEKKAFSHNGKVVVDFAFDTDGQQYKAILKGDFPTIQIFGRPSTTSVYCVIGYGKNKKTVYFSGKDYNL